MGAAVAAGEGVAVAVGLGVAVAVGVGVAVGSAAPVAFHVNPVVSAAPCYALSALPLGLRMATNR